MVLASKLLPHMDRLRMRQAAKISIVFFIFFKLASNVTVVVLHFREMR
jgi:hypothetical protein